ncbi:MAG: TrkH family potassium uptake protein [Fusobacteriaceae bacterium]
MNKIYLKKRYKLISGYCGIVAMIIGAFLFLPLLAVFFLDYNLIDIFSFSILGSFSIILGYFLKKNIKKNQNITLSFQEGGIIVFISWIFAIIVGALPFVINGQLTLTHAIFEAVSGFTTTGLSLVDVKNTSSILLLWRSIMQFLGGVGLAVIMLSSIIGPLGVGLYNAEARSDMLVPNIKNSAKAIMGIYSGYILGGIILYIIAGMPIFDSINHSIAAVSTGGFSTKVDSIGYYNSISIEFITVILMVLGTINFGTHLLIMKGKIKDVLKIGELRTMFFLILVFVPLVVFYTTFPIYNSLSTGIRVGFFEVVSALSTTGFSTTTYFNWSNLGYFILLLAMLIGGGSGSTAGGIKQYRVYVLFKNLWWEIKKMTCSKKTIKENSIYKTEGKVFIDSSSLNEITVILSAYIFTYAICVIILLTQGYNLKESLFEIASCLSTVGLSYGVTSVSASNITIWTMTIAMFLGRLEFLVIFSTFIKFYNDIKKIK